jgi:sigma-B regulation protein RsbU (phosphoserine phosphatase)
VFLAALFVCALAFQATVSKTIWSEAQQAGGSVIPWLAILVNLHLVTPLACLLLGFYVASVRISDPKAWLLLAVLISFSVVSDGSDRSDPVMQWHSNLKHVALVYRSAVFMAWFVSMLIFAIYFPERAAWDRRHPRLKWAILLPALAIYVLSVFERICMNEGPDAQAFIQPVGHMTDILRPLLLYSCLALSLALLLAKLSIARDPDDRRRLRVLFSGLAISFVPAIIFEGFIRRVLGMQFSPWFKLFVYTPLALFPVTLAYVTVVQRALDVRIIVRQGLQYALARRGLTVLQVTISALIVIVIAFLSGEVSFSQRMLLTIAGIAIILITALGARRAAIWIDRRFFREAHNAEQILARLADSVGSLVELPPILTTVATRIAEALHISEIAVFLNERNSYRVAYALGYPQLPEVTFPNESPTIRELQQAKRPLQVYLDDPRSWIGRMTGQDRTELNELGAQLLLPLARREELLGFLALGRRSAEAPYSRDDLYLLRTVAQQTAMAVENSRLTSAIAAETAQREVIERELAIAREVQQRLLPQTYPKVPGLECFAKCRPAREVGGDYYDFLEIPNKGLGIAIGDVSGKGIPASLLMASLQASLRGQTLAGNDNLEKLMANVNQLIYATSPSNRYATFFYAQYEPERRRLAYVNAGHNAPLVLRQNNGHAQLTRLEAGGPPVGLLPYAQYQSSYIDLSAGDEVVLFTDGITEAMNIREEEWGEENLIAAIRNSGNSNPEAIVQTVFRCADEFVGEAPQHDDMTILVLAVGDA